MTTVETIEMAAKFAASIAAIIAAIALFMNAKAFNLQRTSLRASLFNDIRRRMYDLEDQHAEIPLHDKESLQCWYEKLFSLFETYAFYANRGYLDKEMSEYYSAGIDDCAERLKVKYPDLIEYFRSRHAGQFCELDKYFRTVIGKEPPF